MIGRRKPKTTKPKAKPRPKPKPRRKEAKMQQHTTKPGPAKAPGAKSEPEHHEGHDTAGQDQEPKAEKAPPKPIDVGADGKRPEEPTQPK